MRHLLLSAVCVAATESNATFGALADRVEWTRVNDNTGNATERVCDRDLATAAPLIP